MSTRASLRAVADDEKPKPSSSSIFEAAEQGSRIEELRAMRRRMAQCDG